MRWGGSGRSRCRTADGEADARGRGRCAGATERAPARRFAVTLERPEGTLAFLAPEDEYILYSMVDAGIESPYICEQGWCLACAARLKSGEVDRRDALTLYPEDVEAGFVLLCSTKPRSDLVLVQDERQTRREMTQHRIERNQLAEPTRRAPAPVSVVDARGR